MRLKFIIGAIGLFLFGLLFVGCGTTRPQKGGRVRAELGTSSQMTEAVQPENPAAAAVQSQEWVENTFFTIPAGSEVIERTITPGATNNAPAIVKETAYRVSAPVPVQKTIERKVHAETGAAQKDTAREIGAKLASMRGVMWVGIGLVLIGLGSFSSYGQMVLRSFTTSAIITAGGVGLIILPNLVVGHELLLLAAVGTTIGLYFFAHRHGRLQGVVDHVLNQVGANVNQSGAK